jgi:hypothetical protein
MVERDQTLIIAVAGIAATAVVGLAAAAGAWLSARDDRHEQSALARQSLNYERRVAVYLDAIDFVEEQEKSFYEYGILAKNRFRKAHPSMPTNIPLPEFFPNDIPFQEVPPQRLTSRLRALGSNAATDHFRQVEALVAEVPAYSTIDQKGRAILATGDQANKGWGKKLAGFDSAYRAFYDELLRFEDVVHAELGAG